MKTKLLLSVFIVAVLAASMAYAYNGYDYRYNNPYGNYYGNQYDQYNYGQNAGYGAGFGFNYGPGGYPYFDSSLQNNPSVAARVFTGHSERYDAVYTDGYNDGFKDGFFNEFPGYQTIPNPNPYSYRGVGTVGYGSNSDSRFNDGYNDGYVDGKETARYFKNQQPLPQGYGQQGYRYR